MTNDEIELALRVSVIHLSDREVATLAQELGTAFTESLSASADG